MKSVYSAVRTGSLNKAVCASSVKRLIFLLYISARRNDHQRNVKYKAKLLKFFILKNITWSSWHIFKFICFFWHNSPQWVMASSFTRFLDHTQRRTTIGTTPLDEWSARRRDLQLHNTQHLQQTNIYDHGGIRTHDLSRRAAADRADIGIGILWSTVGSRFATVRFTTIHFYDTCRVGPSTPDLWCVTVATQASFLYLMCF